jgi:transcriptional regulator with XRE-family HTH domain
VSALAPPAELRRLSTSQAKRLDVGTRVRWLRVRRNLSHDELASRVGSSRSYLIRIEKGLHTPSADMRARIAVATDSPSDFLSDDDEDDEESDLVRELTSVLRRVIAFETRAGVA